MEVESGSLVSTDGVCVVVQAAADVALVESPSVESRPVVGPSVASSVVETFVGDSSVVSTSVVGVFVVSTSVVSTSLVSTSLVGISVTGSSMVDTSVVGTSVGVLSAIVAGVEPMVGESVETPTEVESVWVIDVIVVVWTSVKEGAFVGNVFLLSLYNGINGSPSGLKF